ncbi:MAG: hypothetical protein OEW77_11440 [Gemmatimonadota bacterium]|nr:hypothetical protein [Gemmatimonadota bacterium]
MFDSLVHWLERAGPLVFWTCAITLLAIDAAAIAVVIGTKSRALVNRWSLPLVIGNVLIVGAGTAIPTAMYVTKVAVQAFAPSVALSVPGAEVAPSP